MTPLHAQWITGFTDGQGCFHVALNRNPGLRFGYQILPEFSVVQHQRDVQILHRLKTYWGCGVVRRNHDTRMCYRVRRLHHLDTVIVPFFEQHTLKTHKHVEFLGWRDVVRAMVQGRHLDPEGFQALVARINTLRVRDGVEDAYAERHGSESEDPVL